jgi:hypothetical protein
MLSVGQTKSVSKLIIVLRMYGPLPMCEVRRPQRDGARDKRCAMPAISQQAAGHTEVPGQENPWLPIVSKYHHVEPGCNRTVSPFGPGPMTEAAARCSLARHARADGDGPWQRNQNPNLTRGRFSPRQMAGSPYPSTVKVKLSSPKVSPQIPSSTSKKARSKSRLSLNKARKQSSRSSKPEISSAKVV